jgi:hypothetical protein
MIGEDLQSDNEINDAIAGAEPGVGLAKPGRQHAVFAHAVQHAISAYDRGIHSP